LFGLVVEHVRDPVEQDRRHLDVVPDIEEKHEWAGHHQDQDGEGHEPSDAQMVPLDF
jgi:hypothetical protein